MHVKKYWSSLGSEGQRRFAERCGHKKSYLLKAISRCQLPPALARKIVLFSNGQVTDFSEDLELKPAYTDKSIGKIKTIDEAAYALLEAVRKYMHKERRMIAWVSKSMDLYVDSPATARAREFINDRDGVVAIYSRICSLSEIKADLRYALKRRGYVEEPA